MSGPPASSSVQIESLPRSLVDLVTREIACVQVRAQLTQSLDDARRQLQALKATRSPFFMLQSQDIRRDARTSQAETEAAIDLTEKRLAQLDQTESRLKPFVAYRLEIHLRNTNPEYVQALLEYRRVEDWQRWLLWFEHYSNGFRGMLALLETTTASLPPTQTLGHHPQCAPLLSQAAAGARQIELEVAFFNKIADAERRLSGPGGHSICRQLALDWCGAVRHLGEADGKHSPQMISQFISQFTEISRNIIRTLQDECVKPVAAETLETNSFHARQWRLLREAIQPRVPLAQLEELVRETDSLLANGRISELAHLQEELQTPAAPRSTSAPFPNNSIATSPSSAPPPKAKPALQLRARGSVTGAPFLNTQPPAPGGQGPR